MNGRLAAFGLAVGLATNVYAGPTPSGFELLEHVRQTYANLETYSDLGEVETTVGLSDQEETTLRFFEARATAAGEFLWRTHGETDTGFEERVIWNDGDEILVYSSLFRQVKPTPSFARELAHFLGRGSYEALVVPLLLAGTEHVLAEPSAVAVLGVEPCGDGQCWVISLTHMGSTIQSELRVHQQSFLIHEVMVTIDNQEASLASDEPLTIRVRHHPNVTAVSSTTFAPPAETRRVVEFEASATDESISSTDPYSGSTFVEEITVALLTVAARIVDSRGEPIRGLAPEDLIVRVGSTETQVLNLEWSSSYQPAEEVPELELLEARALAQNGELTLDPEPTSSGHLIVFFVQVDFDASRVAGHLKILPDVKKLLDSLHPDDRVAIVSFDSHLKVWQDFTNDRETTFEVLKRAISFGTPAARRSRGVSLLEHLDPQAAKDAANPEKALQLTAEALTSLPGEKDMIYMGWGLGRYGAGGVRMTAGYRPAVRALDAARTTVFVLDVSQADYHSLEIGLQNVAAHTGGTYERTLHFASQAVKRLARTIGGRYLVTIDRSQIPLLRGPLSMRLRDRKGQVLFKPLTLG